MRLCRLILRISMIVVALAALALPAWPGEDAPFFSFGVIADIQYADQDMHGPRDYRASVAKLQACSAALNSKKLAFVIQPGDLVDGGLDNLDRILPLFDKIRAPKYHVLGNHDFCADRSVLLKKLRMPGAYYQFSEPGWRFVVLDGMNVSAAGSWPEGSENLRRGREMLSHLKQQNASNAEPWNGAIGEDQRCRLQDVLFKADRDKENVIVFSHFPVLPASCRPNHLSWDHEELVELLEKHPRVRGFFNGHDHNGGYAIESGIHYLTFSAMVEKPVADTCNVVDVNANHLTIRSSLSGTERVLAFQENAKEVR